MQHDQLSQELSFVNTVMNFRVPKSVEKFVSECLLHTKEVGSMESFLFSNPCVTRNTE
jgi:hypothetical protein